MRYGLLILGVLFRLEETLDGDAVALLQDVEGLRVLVVAPDLYIKNCADALLVFILALCAGDCQAEAGY